MKPNKRGGSRGIGRKTAEFFAQQGWTVFVTARTESQLQDMQAAWSEKFPASALFTFCADLSTPAACTAWAADIATHTNRLNVLLNNLGQFYPGTLLDDDPAQLADFFAANVLSTHYLVRAVLPLLQQAEPAHLITVGLVATSDWPAPFSAYAWSKHAQEAWHRGVQKELAGSSIKRPWYGQALLLSAHGMGYP